MSDIASQFIGGIPENYDQRLGPNIFFDYADDIARRAASAPRTKVLELAAGTGIVSRRLRDALPDSTQLHVSDLNAPMLDVAKTKFDASEPVEFGVANAMALPFDDDAFDLAICQFGIMFFPDKVASLRETRRVLSPGGQYIFNTWGTLAQNPFSRIADDVAAQFFPDNPPGFYKVPFCYPAADVVMADMEEAGFADISHEVIALQKPVVDAASFARGLVFGNPLLDEIKQRGGVDPEAVVTAIHHGLLQEFGETSPSMPLLATVFTGTAP